MQQILYPIMTKHFLSGISALVFLFPLALLAQKGVIAGKIIDAKLADVLIGVTVRLDEGAGGAITDFDGNPLADSSERRLPQSPLIAVASMVQSIDHVGRIVVKRRYPDRCAEVDEFIRVAVDAALVAYGPVDREVLHALRVAQELHEYLYAATHLPRWMYVPAAALPALLDL